MRYQYKNRLLEERDILIVREIAHRCGMEPFTGKSLEQLCGGRQEDASAIVVMREPFMLDDGETIIVMQDPVGFAVMQWNEDILFLLQLAVHPGFQGAGAGGWLWLGVRGIQEHKGLSRIVCSVHRKNGAGRKWLKKKRCDKTGIDESGSVVYEYP